RSLVRVQYRPFPSRAAASRSLVKRGPLQCKSATLVERLGGVLRAVLMDVMPHVIEFGAVEGTQRRRLPVGMNRVGYHRGTP
ncbi:MAG: hypothetical protein KF678_05485, partial [Phycisphaeraceae bacterium]|nr:hypothetical protein [Phycisphaeraceae bacterium]